MSLVILRFFLFEQKTAYDMRISDWSSDVCSSDLVTSDDFRRFTHIVALDAQNLADLEALRPADGNARLSLLLDHIVGKAGQAVPDPYHGGPEGFNETWALVDEAARALAQQIALGDRID